MCIISIIEVEAINCAILDQLDLCITVSVFILWLRRYND